MPMCEIMGKFKGQWEKKNGLWKSGNVRYVIMCTTRLLGIQIAGLSLELLLKTCRMVGYARGAVRQRMYLKKQNSPV